MGELELKVIYILSVVKQMTTHGQAVGEIKLIVVKKTTTSTVFSLGSADVEIRSFSLERVITHQRP